MRIFYETQLSDFLEARRHAMLQEIQNESPNKLLNVNESDFVKYLSERYRVEPIVFEFDSLESSYDEKMIPAERHPPDFGCRSQHSYPRQVFTFHLPFNGEVHLLKCQPSCCIMWAANVALVGNEIRFELINWRDDSAALMREQKDIVEHIRKQNENVTNEVSQFNSRLEEQARQAVTNRRSQLLKQANVAESLGIPVRRAANVPQTFSVPVVPRKIVVKPATSASTRVPEPTLENFEYQNILSIIHDVGVGMERLPSTYAHKQEEDLRDYLLIPLCTHYPNSTGETFNKKGKTDILIRHESSNIFVGECKFWKGLKAFHETIDQILGYLTWRDSKAAILCFVNNKELNPVLEQISKGTPQHQCFVRLESKRIESWTQFEFRLKSDPTRNVHLAVLCFHFPPN
jgi:hypothetical protein